MEMDSPPLTPSSMMLMRKKFTTFPTAWIHRHNKQPTHTIVILRRTFQMGFLMPMLLITSVIGAIVGARMRRRKRKRNALRLRLAM
jgi:uncharacterized membrane protein YfcA